MIHKDHYQKADHNVLGFTPRDQQKCEAAEAVGLTSFYMDGGQSRI